MTASRLHTNRTRSKWEVGDFEELQEFRSYRIRGTAHFRRNTVLQESLNNEVKVKDELKCQPAS